MVIHQIKTYLKIGLMTLLIWAFLDQFLRLSNVGAVLPEHYDKQNLQRKATPYIEFKGAPNKLDHDQHGYRWLPKTVDDRSIKIAFFGGSTGYQGDPPIALILESLLNQTANPRVQVANFSVVSSNHRQHLHNIIESRVLFEPDLIIFYGGYNETVQSGFYDPRPGYPYNYYYRNETPPLNQLLIRYSPTFYLIDKILTRHGLGGLTPLAELKTAEQPFSPQWNEKIVSKYFETLDLAQRITGSFESAHCGKALFRFFYQPFQVPKQFLHAHEMIRSKIPSRDFGFDVSDTLAKRNLGDVYTDVVHLKQIGNQAIAEEIAARLLHDAGFARCMRQ